MTIENKDKDIITDILQQENITHIIESGTYLGLGSTKSLAESLKKINRQPSFITIEANWESWHAARRNLKMYSFVTPIWGKTVSTDQALEFIAHDDAILHHEKYPEIYIDNTINPVKFYSDEIKGKLGRRFSNPLNMILKLMDSFTHYGGEDCLSRYLQLFRNNNPLILLDSAGGIGYLEFNTVKNIMGNSSYLLLLDDIHHLKHFRSLRDIQNDDQFNILQLDINNGWVFAKHIQT